MKATNKVKTWIASIMTVVLLAGCGVAAMEAAPVAETAKASSDTTTASSAVAEPVAEKWPEKLVMGFLPNEESTPENKTSNKMHQEDISAYLGIPVEMVICEDYNAVIETMKNKKTHLASFGPFSYIIAKDRSNAEALVVSCKNGDAKNAFYSSVFIASPDSGIKSIADLKGKSFAFVDPASTSGNLVPRSVFVREFSVTPEEIDTKLFSSTQFSGSHNNSLLAVANKSVEAAACTRQTYENGIKKGVVTEKEVVIIGESDPIPNSPIAVRSDLPADLKAKIKEFYLQWNNEEYHKLRGSEGNRYMEIKDSDYDTIREIAAKMNMKPEDLLK